MHDGVGNGRDVVPAKGWASEGKGVGHVVWIADGEDELRGEGGGEEEGPVKVCNVGVVEEDGFFKAEDGFEVREVGKGEFFGVEGLGEIGRLAVEDGAELGGV